MKNALVFLAFVSGIIAVSMAAFQNNFIHTSPTHEVSKESQRSLKEVAADAAKTLLEEKVLHKEPPPKPVTDPRRLPLHPYQIVFTALGLVAIGLGVFSWTQKAHTRLAAAAVGLGIMAIAWEWVLIAVGVAVVIFVLSILSA
jgi:hypothetical protein